MKFRVLVAGLLLVLSQFAHAQSCYDYYNNYICTNLTVTATAGGQVTSAPVGISCPGTCSDAYPFQNVTLTATANSGFVFTGWSGACTGSGTCTVLMSKDTMVTASFATGAAAVVPQTGFWYNPAEGGRGYVIEAHADNNLFIGGFMYDANGNAVWYASGPGAMSGSTYTGVWQQYGNGETLTGSFVASSIVNADVGNITLQFLTTTTATLTLPDGRQISLTRYPF